MNNNDINKKINSAISGMENGACKRKLQGIIGSQKADRVKSGLSDADKAKILKRFGSVSEEQLKRTLYGVSPEQLAKFSSMSADEIIRAIKKL